MVPRSHSEDSDPVLEVSAIGTANPDGEYVQHEAVAPQKPHPFLIDPLTVVVRESTPSAAGTDASEADSGQDPSELADATSTEGEITSATKSRFRTNGAAMFRVLAYVETHRLATLSLAIGGLLLLIAGALVLR
jgi:hypothetical protein